MKLKKYFFHEEWNTGIMPLSREVEVEKLPKMLPETPIHWLSRRFHFQADPFLVADGGVLYVFYEALNHHWVRGRIRCRVLDPGLREVDDFELTGVNALRCHLSFPFVFRHQDEWYMIPETHELGQVLLFKASDFPKHWQYAATLVRDAKLVDSFLWQRADGFYLISAEHKTNRSVVHRSDMLHQGWQPDTGTIQSGDHHTRPGGGLFEVDDVAYAPFQECRASEYGKSLYLKQMEMDRGVLKTDTVVHIQPFSSQYGDGVHTLNITNGYLVVDAKRWVFQPLNFFVRKFKQIASFFNQPKHVKL